MQLIFYVVYSFLNFQEMERDQDKSFPIKRTENSQTGYNHDSTESTVGTVESKERKTAADRITGIFLKDVQCVEKGKQLQDINEVALKSTLLNKITDDQESINASNQSLTFKSGDASSFKPGEIFMVTSYEELKKLLENYYVSTSSVFITVQKTKEFGCEGMTLMQLQFLKPSVIYQSLPNFYELDRLDCGLVLALIIFIFNSKNVTYKNTIMNDIIHRNELL